LAAAASSVKALAALVIRIPASGIDVFQDLFAHFHLGAQQAEEGGTVTSGFLAGNLAQGDLKLFGFVGEITVGGSVFTFAELVWLEGFLGKAAKNHGD